MPTATVGPEFGIQDVWASNLEEEFRKIRQVVQKYNYVAMVSIWRDVFPPNICFVLVIGFYIKTVL